MFTILLWTVLCVVHGGHSDRIGKKAHEQVLLTPGQILTGNISNFHCEELYALMNKNVSEATEESIQISLSHPFLDISQGLVAGVVYDVQLTSSENAELPLVVTSFPPGNFTAYPSSAVPCIQPNRSLPSIVLLTLKTKLNLKWLLPLNTSEDIIRLKIVHHELGDHWMLSRSWRSRRSECFKRIPSQKQSLTSEDLSSHIRNCTVYKVFIDPYPSSRASFQLLNLTSPATHSDWLRLTVEGENSSEHIVSATNRYKNEPFFVAIGCYFLLTVYMCEDCRFWAVFSPLDNAENCNVSVDALQGILTSPNFPEKYLPGKDYFYHIKAPPGYKIFLTVVEIDLYSTNAQRQCAQDYVRVFPLEQKKEVFLCGNSSNLSMNKLLESQHETLNVHFRTKGMTQGKGFLLKFRSSKQCRNVTITQQNGTICSQDYPYAFVSKQSCLYAFYVPFGYEIDLEFSFLETSSSTVKSEQGCLEEFIEISSLDRVVRLCGRQDEQVTQDLRFRSGSYNMNITVNLNAITTSVNEARGFCVNFHAIPLTQNNTFCEYPWTVKGSYCYQLLDQYMNWQSAKNRCISLGGHLATISTDDIQSFLETLIKTSSLYGHAHAFWIGASDIEHENCYTWEDGLIFRHSNWFPGWSQHNNYNSQPSDDGLSSQDCVEMRDLYRYPSKGEGQTDNFYWNDRNCEVKNPFICQRPKPGVHIETFNTEDCNETFFLDANHPHDIISSPGYPEYYPDLIECYYEIRAPNPKKINLEFTDFLLEDHESCNYDYLEIQDGDNAQAASRHCGDYRQKLKLLRHLSSTNQLKLKFLSDFSYSNRGFRAEVRLWNDNVSPSAQCDSKIFHLFGNQCYLLASYPEVSWHTARQICAESEARLATIYTLEEKRFVNYLIQSTEAFRSGLLYWVGGVKEIGTKTWHWVDGQHINQSELTEHNRSETSTECLALQWLHRDDVGDLYLVPSKCHQPGRYICKKNAVVLPESLNKTFGGTNGTIVSVNFPNHYVNNLHYTVIIKGGPLTRIYLQFEHLDIEKQDQCMYDYISLQSDLDGPETRFCGQHQNDLNRFFFYSDNNTAYLTFHSDFSITSTGFQATWKAIDVSVCVKVQQISVTHKTTYTSLNYPEGYLPNLHCVAKFRTPESAIILTFYDFDVGLSQADGRCRKDYLKVTLESGRLRRSLNLCGNSSLVPPGYQVLSYDNSLTVELFTNKHGGRGFNVTLETLLLSGNGRQVKTMLNISSNWNGILRSMNYPHSPPESINYTQQIVTVLGTYLILYFPKAFWSEGGCDSNFLVVRDIYKERDSVRTLCFESNDLETSSEFQFQSVFNSIHLDFWTTNNATRWRPFTIDYKVILDSYILNKSLRLNSSRSLDGCFCENGGSCVEVLEGRFKCQCTGHFTGLFCHLPWCSLNPCRNYGTCSATNDGYKCSCTEEFTGDHCDQAVTPCNPNPCGKHGDCSVVNNTFFCRCHVWYEGPRCSRYVFRIIYKPLSKRMLEEPFWLGLITVSAVLFVILLVYCIKRKFADKIEKFFVEEIERNPSPVGTRYSLSSNQASLTPVATSPQPCSKSFLNRIRKHSIRSVRNNHHSPSDKDQARTFSFDDILKRSFSSRKQSYKASESEKNEVETSRIIASLVHSNQSSKNRRMSLDDFIKMNGKKIRLNTTKDENQGYMSDMSTKSEDVAETSFIGKLSPRFPHYSAPSFTEFHSIKEQSFEQASSSDSLSCDVKMGETKVEISLSPQQASGQSDCESIEDKPTREVPSIPVPQVDSFSEPQKPVKDNDICKTQTITNDEIPYQINPSTENTELSNNTPVIPNVLLEVSSPVDANPLPIDDAATEADDISEINLPTPPSTASPKQELLEFPIPEKHSFELSTPKILITANLSSCDSEETSPPQTPNTKPPLMNYLSPLTAMCPSSDRTISESNLSTSGYSSLSSPGMSRCNSSSPLAEELEVSTKKLYLPQKASHLLSPSLLATKCENAFQFPPQQIYSCLQVPHQRDPSWFPERRASVGGALFPPPKDIGHFLGRKLSKRISYQTTSTEDSIDDEGIVLDTIDVKIKQGEVTSAKELEKFVAFEKYQKMERDNASNKQNRKPSPLSLQIPDISTPCSTEKHRFGGRNSPKPKKGDRSRKLSDRGRSSACSSPSVTPVNERLPECQEGKLPRNLSKTSMGSQAMSSSDDDLDSHGPRHKSPRRPYKRHETQSSPSLRHHKATSPTSPRSKSLTQDPSHEFGDKSSRKSNRTAFSSSSESILSTADDNFTTDYSTDGEKLRQKLGLSSVVLQTPEKVREKFLIVREDITTRGPVTSESQGLVSSPTRSRARQQSWALQRQRSQPEQSRRRRELVSLDSIESSIPSDSDDELKPEKLTQPVSPIPTKGNQTVHAALRRQEALIEDDGSEDSISETTVLLKKPLSPSAVLVNTMKDATILIDPNTESFQNSFGSRTDHLIVPQENDSRQGQV
ncbi:uncharacterized protein LOC111086422 isoform X2 [Limulus polyphemus]|uniref:Uncharacterized protein LOC111086422 isoform X2 n=1 Tax=Limulus polyphemus TaxID=6850 RepID=A0ABM1SMM7_LIMPO|nr:uncharacterized protein LOC111086422 isoform X2 [Limulus polyphemus]